MIDFLLHILIVSVWIFGINCLFAKDHFFEKIGNLFRTETDDIPPQYEMNWLTKPLFDCASCMASVHGLLWYFLGFPLCFHDALPLRLLIPFLISLCGWNYFLLKLTTKERIIVDE